MLPPVGRKLIVTFSFSLWPLAFFRALAPAPFSFSFSFTAPASARGGRGCLQVLARGGDRAWIGHRDRQRRGGSLGRRCTDVN